MTVSRKALREEVKMEYVSKFMEFLSNTEDDVLRVKSNEIAFPILDREGNEDFVVVKISIPTGSNKGTEPYDAYALAEEYSMKCKEKEEKAKIAKEKKMAKIAKDKERREKEKNIHKNE